MHNRSSPLIHKLSLYGLALFLILVSLISFTTIRNEKDGFKQIFDGKTLKGWDGDSTYWSVEDGCIVGRITPATLLKRNSFLIWRG